MFYQSPKGFFKVFIEAIVVGVLLAGLYLILQNYINKNGNDTLNVFIAAILTHLIFEYTAINEWYSKEYCKLL